MRIIRFIDADDAVHWGLEAEGDQASVTHRRFLRTN